MYYKYRFIDHWQQGITDIVELAYVKLEEFNVFIE